MFILPNICFMILFIPALSLKKKKKAKKFHAVKTSDVPRTILTKLLDKFAMPKCPWPDLLVMAMRYGTLCRHIDWRNVCTKIFWLVISTYVIKTEQTPPPYLSAILISLVQFNLSCLVFYNKQSKQTGSTEAFLVKGQWRTCIQLQAHSSLVLI